MFLILTILWYLLSAEISCPKSVYSSALRHPLVPFTFPSIFTSTRQTCPDLICSKRMSSTERDIVVDNSHTIILCQFTEKANSKMYSDHESVSGAMEALCQLYEAQLKRVHSNSKQITYDISDLYKFIDDLPDVGVLVYNQALGAYTPHGKEWVKRRLFTVLKDMSQS